MEAVDWAGPSVLPRWRPLIPLFLSSLPHPKLEGLLKSGFAERSRCGLGWALGPSSLVFSASLSLSLYLSFSLFLSLSSAKKVQRRSCRNREFAWLMWAKKYHHEHDVLRGGMLFGGGSEETPCRRPSFCGRRAHHSAVSVAERVDAR